MDIGSVRDALDTDSEIRVSSVHSVCEALVLFLDSLPEPVIPYDQYTECIEQCTHLANSKRTLKLIEFSHRNVFKYICAFLRELLRHSDTNRSNAKFLSQVFGDVLLKPRLPESGNGSKSSSKKRSLFVYQFLINEYDEWFILRGSVLSAVYFAFLAVSWIWGAVLGLKRTDLLNQIIREQSFRYILPLAYRG